MPVKLLRDFLTESIRGKKFTSITAPKGCAFYEVEYISQDRKEGTIAMSVYEFYPSFSFFHSNCSGYIRIRRDYDFYSHWRDLEYQEQQNQPTQSSQEMDKRVPKTVKTSTIFYF